MNFKQKFKEITVKNNSLVCVGLDPDTQKIPEEFKKNSEPLFSFNKHVIDQTAGEVCAYKPNSAFYEAYGAHGIEQLKKTIDYIKDIYPEIPVILDAKRGDIGNTSTHYARFAYEYLGADALTAYVYMGHDSVVPFLKYEDKMTFLLIRTSNPDAHQFQDMKIGEYPYYLALAHKIHEWKEDNFGIFVGATYPKELATVREVFPHRVFLTAGVGAQEATLEEVIKAGVDREGKNLIVNSSRSIIYSQNPRKEVELLRNRINTIPVR